MLRPQGLEAVMRVRASNGLGEFISISYLYLFIVWAIRLMSCTVCRYPGFNTQLDFAQLHNDLRWNVLRPQGLEAVMRVRASNGLGEFISISYLYFLVVWAISC